MEADLQSVGMMTRIQLNNVRARRLESGPCANVIRGTLFSRAKSSRELHFLFVIACRWRDRLGSPCREQIRRCPGGWTCRWYSKVLLLPRLCNECRTGYIAIRERCSAPRGNHSLLLILMISKRDFAAVKCPDRKSPASMLF